MNESLAKNNIFMDRSLAPNDKQEKNVPIRYASGCSRRIIRDVGKDVFAGPLAFGYVVSEPKYTPAVIDAIYRYKRVLAVNLLNNVYKQHLDDYDYDALTREAVDDVLERLYPSNYHWLISEDCRGFVGDSLDAQDMDLAYKEMIYGGPHVRKAYLGINSITKTLNPITDQIIETAIQKDNNIGLNSL